VLAQEPGRSPRDCLPLSLAASHVRGYNARYFTDRTRHSPWPAQ
jgi:hypothetical protein